MSVLLKEIQNYSSAAARALEKADFRTDTDIQSLTREDLHELFPGADKLKLRRAIFKIIKKQKPVEKLLQDLRGLIPEDSVKEALATNGVLISYLHLLKDLSDQLSNVQSFVEAHIGLLEELKAQAQPQQKHDSDNFLVSPTTASRGTPNETTPQKCQASFAGSQFYRSLGFGSYGSSHTQQVTVKYKMEVSGKTFDAHRQILHQVQSSSQQLSLVESQSSEDCKIVLVFCPIVSRAGTDVEAAMKRITGNKPVILVLMHHSHESKPVATSGSCDNNHRILKQFHVFYHEREGGLIKCKVNNEAISGIQNELSKIAGN